MMNLRRLRCFMAAVTAESFGKAADQLNIARPAFSRHIAQLEDEIGVELFQRSRGRAKLTQVGRIYARQVEEVLAKLDIANADIGHFSRNRRSLVRIGLPEFATPDAAIVNAINTLRLTHPEIEFTILPMTSVQQVRAIETAEIDIGLIYNWPGSSDALETFTFATDLFVLAMSESHALASNESVSIADIRDEHFVSFSPELAPGSFNRVMAWCSERYFTPKIRQFAPTPSGLYLLVGTGVGLAFVVDRARAPDTVVKKRLNDMELTVPVDFIWRRSETRHAVQAAIRTLIATLVPSQAGKNSA